jgi:flagella basal body P-ring formation protein FlgA
VEIWIDVVVSAQRLGKKQILTQDDVKLARRDIGGLAKRFFADTNSVAGKEILSTIAKDIVIQDWMVRLPPEASKNEEVSILAENENLKVTARGLALEDGYKGDKIKVRNLDSNKEIKAVVSGSGEVTVELK